MKRFLWFLSIVSFGFAVMLTYCPRVGVSAAPAPGPGDTFNLLSFGAVGDGTHDDGPALQAALNAIANAHGGTLIVPAGQFAIVTPVIKDFSFANSVEIRGVASTTLINTKGTGEQISHGLDLTSQFVIKTGYPNIGLQITSLRNLLISDMVFIGTPQASTDARVPLVLAGIDNAVIRHCEFYGLSSVNERWSDSLRRRQLVEGRSDGVSRLHVIDKGRVIAPPMGSSLQTSACVNSAEADVDFNFQFSP